MTKANSIVTIALMLLASCGKREETPNYFRHVTGIQLCPEASVRNVNAQAADRSPGFDSIYIVDVAMPGTCEPGFLRSVEQQIGVLCTPGAVCTGQAKNGAFLRVDRRPGGFRITHST